jgi:hypothetical protein
MPDKTDVPAVDTVEEQSVQRARRLTPDVLREAAKGSAGIMSHIAAKLNLTRAAVSQAYNVHDWARQIIDDERRKILDVIETNVVKHASTDPTLGVKVLERLDRDRWGVKTDVNVSGTVHVKTYEMLSPDDFPIIDITPNGTSGQTEEDE